MGQTSSSVDQLYILAERLAQDFSLFPRKQPASVIKGLVSEQQIEIKLEQLRGMDVDAYIAATVSPCEEASRPGARAIVEALGVSIVHTVERGPLYAVEVEMDFGESIRRVAIIAQNRTHGMGVWGPEHHELAAQLAANFATRSLPIVCLMDTPGADASQAANANNQAHSISRLIAELCNVDVPTVGIIVGQGYSGGAIPLAASNLLLSLRTGVFNTIHPKGLASLVRRYNLSWQECAQFVGVSPYELYKQGNIDGVIDYDPGEDDKIVNLRSVIVSSILSIEASARDFVSQHPETLEHYKRNINRYLRPSESLAAVHANSTLKLRASPTEYPNIFGVTFRYLRYLSLRKRIKSTTIRQYGRLAASEIPEGELAQRIHRERRAAFLGWLQDPDKILYEDALNKAWKNYLDKKSQASDERGRFAQLIFGEPGRNYAKAKRDLCLVCGTHLYNRWKAGAKDNLIALIQHMQDEDANAFLLRSHEVTDVKALLRTMSDSDDVLIREIKSRVGFEGRKLFSTSYIEEKSADFLQAQLVSELNLIIEGPSLYSENLAGLNLSNETTRVLERGESKGTIELNRRLLEDSLWSYVVRKSDVGREAKEQDLTILDIILNEDIREDFIKQCRNLITFSVVYDNLIGDLVSVARQAHESRTLPAAFIAKLVEKSLAELETLSVFPPEVRKRADTAFSSWIGELANHSRAASFLKAWNRIVHVDKSDTLFVVISFFFEKLLPGYYASVESGRRYNGKVEPVRIGRRKDFWNRLTIAYRDLLFHELLTREKRTRKTTYQTLLDRFVRDFKEMNSNLMSANPVAFPTFRPSRRR
jgi:hypothetical protein